MVKGLSRTGVQTLRENILTLSHNDKYRKLDLASSSDGSYFGVPCSGVLLTFAIWEVRILLQ